MKITAENSEKLCKFQNSGFCKFDTTCNFKHVFDICTTENCDKSGCYKRHPRRCRYYFLRRRCKFRENCKYSHGEDHEQKEVSVIREEIERIKKENQALENEMKIILSANTNLEECFNSQKVQLEQINREKDALEVENRELKEVNDNLIEDLTILNERLTYMIPGTLEEENLELKESIAILKCQLEMYKNMEERKQAEDHVETVDEERMETERIVLYCDFCPFETFSQQGLQIHIGMKHKKEKVNE